MKKILFLCESLEIGGAEMALFTLLTHIKKDKYNITVCSLCDTGYYSDLIKQIPGVKYTSVLYPSSKGIKKYLYKVKYNIIYKILPISLIYKLFIPKNNDVEIAFCEGFSTKILSYSTNIQSKKIAWVHTDLLHNNWPVSLGVYKDIVEEKKNYMKYNKIIGVSKSVSENLTQFLSNKICTLYNPIDINRICKLSEVSIDYKFCNGSINIVSIGRLEQVKGYDRLIKICSRLINQDKLNITLTIIGMGSKYDDLKMLIDTNRIKLLGSKKNPYPYINKADLYVCPSYQEGYNIALTEAIVLGRPCVATKCSGPDEILDNGNYGYLVDNNEDALYLCLKELISNPIKLHQLKSLSKQRRIFFDLNKNISQIESVLDE